MATCCPVATSTAVKTVPDALRTHRGRGKGGGREGRGGREEKRRQYYRLIDMAKGITCTCTYACVSLKR